MPDTDNRHLLEEVFPKFLFTYDGMERWVPMNRAGAFYDDGWADVRIVGKVMTSDGRVRPITDDERKEIVRRADEYSGSK